MSDKQAQAWGMDVTTFCTLLHLSQFMGFFIPGAGLILPVVMWGTNKDEHPIINAHGRVVMNWMVTAFIYLMVSAICVAIVVGIPMLFALLIADLVFVVLGAIKASKNELWKYPFSFDFFGAKNAIAQLEGGE